MCGKDKLCGTEVTSSRWPHSPIRFRNDGFEMNEMMMIKVTVLEVPSFGFKPGDVLREVEGE